MQIAVLGAGLMGRAAVYALARTEGVERVIVADREPGRAEAVAKSFGNDRVQFEHIDVADGLGLRTLLWDCDVVLGAVTYRYNLEITRACIDARTHYCDLGGNHAIVESQFLLSEAVAQSEISVVPDCGLAPGLVSILAARLLEIMPSATSIHIRVGGLPQHPRPPFNYNLVFSVTGLINEYKEPSYALREGKVVQVRTLGDLEAISFPPPFGQLEAFNTSGGVSTLPFTLRPRIQNLDYKTIRYPGHRDLIEALFSLGLAHDEPELIDGTRVIPRRILEHHLAKSLCGDDPDVVLVRVEAIGPDGRKAFRIVDSADEEKGLSAMMRCTAFPAAIVACMLGTGEISTRGTLHQELVVPTRRFIDELETYGIEVVDE